MSTINTSRKPSTSRRVDIEAALQRCENTLTNLRITDVKEVRLMHGTIAHTIVCDGILPIAGIKKAYVQAIKARIVELKYELLETTNKE